jgi:hypothetical protein
MRDLARRERVGDVEHPHTRVLVGGEDQLRLPSSAQTVRLRPGSGKANKPSVTASAAGDRARSRLAARSVDGDDVGELQHAE